jgi:hypothetical protein
METFWMRFLRETRIHRHEAIVRWPWFGEDWEWVDTATKK